MKFQAIAAELEFLAWRDAQLAAISLQLEDAFPDLLDDLSAQVERAGRVDLVRSRLTLKSSTEAIIQRWGVKQLNSASSRAEAELEDAILQLPGGLKLDSDIWEQGSNVLPAIAGVGLIAGSVAAIPTVISFATVSTSFLAFWGAATISWPLFALGATGIGVATFLGSKSLKSVEARARKSLCNRVHREADRQGFGIGGKPGARCILSDIQAAVVKAGQNRIQGVS
ncbi:hypothetical protein [Pseudooceanicola sp.]|uniref:hypothetical protein n=1 Tax=Pseudooceanicola sp. TaxID=1914328 RepID=UPI0026028406|nr:hypothetical protein [Pseudooceanicola sp.]MDF1856565.1 hypothetical protein [Pseudooceanicola sp.]